MICASPFFTRMISLQFGLESLDCDLCSTEEVFGFVNKNISETGSLLKLQASSPAISRFIIMERFGVSEIGNLLTIPVSEFSVVLDCDLLPIFLFYLFIFC